MATKKEIKEILNLALPAVGEMLLYMVVWVVDTMMVGQFGGKDSVSAVGLASEIIYTFSNIFIAMGISIGVTSYVARSIGAKDFEVAKKYASQGIFLGFIFAIFISLILFTFAGNFLIIAGATGNVLVLGRIFIKIASIGIFFNMLMNILNAILRAQGNTKPPMIGASIVIFINILLDWILIFGKFGLPALGAKGSAIATTIAQITGFIFIMLYYFNQKILNIELRDIVDFDRQIIVDILKLAFPASLQEAAFDISRLISIFMIMHLGTVAFAANQIATTIESISFMPGWGFAVAATTMAGQMVGAKKYDSAKRYTNISALFAVAIMGTMSILFLTIPHLFIRAFIKDADVIAVGILCLMVASIEQPFMAVGMVYGGGLKGSGNTKTPFIISTISSWFIRLPLMYVVIYILKLGVVYVWFVTAIQWAFEGTTMYLYFRKEINKLKGAVKDF
ncbi:putative efflux protein, MATE family [Thermoanaerobacter thermohydrosulfuricus]|uniref:Probable multidrug resistance protein NorM n=2 Tax=Thermoanaerobacter thermohydrosulfuricus TaxID=1516 RepID=M8DFF4_THETY|nr:MULTISPECIES: MATE family efflux transporter [Thermoanaerobacter]EMT38757.1 putative efflux protein, MATE family [Thermoanaerobacter thermohydrosulfuricus WC1]UZQ82287.1 MATE family efflux transporter [Thermoanaerobacter sp. RKWS2]SDG71890.1 putative efflux protein, MATE family [Thermoanaerobacter thermohydrosulfuricus]